MKTDVDGDAGYLLSITNNRDAKAWFYSSDAWTVNGTPTDQPVLRVAVYPGETAEEFMWFDHNTSSVASERDLTNVEGGIMVADAASSALVGTYPFEVLIEQE